MLCLKRTDLAIWLRETVGPAQSDAHKAQNTDVMLTDLQFHRRAFALLLKLLAIDDGLAQLA
jgi:hypothetical protein